MRTLAHERNHLFGCVQLGIYLVGSHAEWLFALPEFDDERFLKALAIAAQAGDNAMLFIAPWTRKTLNRLAIRVIEQVSDRGLSHAFKALGEEFPELLPELAAMLFGVATLVFFVHPLSADPLFRLADALCPDLFPVLASLVQAADWQ